jgi:hypothetical protein
VDETTRRPGIKTCSHLIRLKSGRTLCRIYNDKRRLKKDIGAGNQCNEREKVRWDYEGCPLNAGRILILDEELGLRGGGLSSDHSKEEKQSEVR